MNNSTFFAASYNCTDAANSAYGAGNYSTCETANASVGAPNTGDFFANLTGGQFSIILPTVLALVIAVASAIAILRKKKKSDNSAK